MPDEATQRNHISTLEVQLDELRTQLRRQQVLIALGLVLASFLVPVISFDTDPDSADGDRETARLLGAMGEYFGGDLDLGSTSVHPYAIPGGLLLTKIGLVAVLVGLVAIALTCWWSLDELTWKRVVPPKLAAAVLIFGVVVLWLGQGWLPDDDLGTHTAWSLLVVAACGVWQLHLRRR